MVGRTILHGIRCARDGARGVRALPRNEPEKEGVGGNLCAVLFFFSYLRVLFFSTITVSAVWSAAVVGEASALEAETEVYHNVEHTTNPDCIE